MCLATGPSVTADQGVASSVPAWSHTFVEIGHEIISTVVLLPSAKSFKKGCCQLQVKVCARSNGGNFFLSFKISGHASIYAMECLPWYLSPFLL